MNTLLKFPVLFVLALSLICQTAEAYSIPTRRSTMTMKRGRGSFKKELNDGASSGMGSSSAGAGAASYSGRNWIQTNQKTSVLPQEEGKVGILETKAFLLVDKATNPNGAVSVMKYGPQTYCFSVSCPQCKIPLTKAKALPPNEETNNEAPRVCCDFCKSTYNLKTGEQVESGGSAGIFGGIAKAVLSSQESAPLPVYELAEKNGNVLFNMD